MALKNHTKEGEDTASEILTEQDKSRIREEMWFREGVRKQIEKTTPQKAKTFWDFFNSPGGVAILASIIGGISVSIVGNLWQSRSAEHERQVKQQQILLDRKQNLVNIFSEDYESSIMLYDQYLRSSAWLIWNSNDPTVKNHFGESRSEVLKKTNDLWLRYALMRKYNSLLPRIRVVYHNPSVLSLARQLRIESDKFGEIQAPKLKLSTFEIQRLPRKQREALSVGYGRAMETQYSKLDKLYHEIISAMEMEIEQDTKDTNRLLAPK